MAAVTKRRVRVVVLCEALQDATFAGRFLRKRGWTPNQIRIERGAPGSGAGEQYVRNRFPTELGAVRRDSVHRALIVMIDGDTIGREERLRQLETACTAAGVPPRRSEDRVAVLVPTRNIETWFQYLDGHEADERWEYPKLSRQRDCQRHVDELAVMCGSDLRQPAPPSLRAACDEFRTRILGS
jgi:hypothetical protein